MEEYKRKLVTADEAVKAVKSGDTINFGEFMMVSEVLDAALAKRTNELQNVNIITTTCPFPPKTVLADPNKEHFIYNDWHFSGASRKLHDKGLCYYIPLLYHEAPTFYDRGYVPIDVALIKVAPMDKHGYFTLGTSTSIGQTQIEHADKVIVVVNKHQPRTYGNTAVHISKVSYIVENNHELAVIPQGETTDNAVSIAESIDGSHKTSKAVINEEICLGCGVCVRNCPKKSIGLERRNETIITPVNTVHRFVLLAIEKGMLQNLIFDNQAFGSHRAMAAVLSVILKLPPIKQALASKQLKSVYLDRLLSKLNV
jgi:acyl-CoA hydrolase